MAHNNFPRLSVFSLLLPHKKNMALSVSGEKLKIVADHNGNAHHTIEDITVMINGLDVVEKEYSTIITDKEEVVTIVLPFEPQPGDVIVVDTVKRRLGSHKITLKVS